jgi:glycosyltransferase involved in cell wall biosynthesis
MNMPKVSMVVPCYNKKEYITEMLDSVLNQVYNNIELILVDDGSTDGTEQIIRDYVPKFMERGFEVVIIRQKNQGLHTAVQNGLRRYTGDFICFPDCDDTLESEYVSYMADYLINNPQCEMVRCKTNLKEQSDLPFEDNILEAIMFDQHYIHVWCYFVRTSLLSRIDLLNKQGVFSCNSQEPDITIPLLYNAENFKRLDRHLYNYRYCPGITTDRETQLSIKQDFVNYQAKLAFKTIADYNLPSKYFLYYNIYFIHARIYCELLTFEEAFEQLKDITAKLGFHDLIERNNTYYDLFLYVKNRVLNIKYRLKKDIRKKASSLVVFYGVLGKKFDKYFEKAPEIKLAADTLWDNAALPDSVIDGVKVQKPDFPILSVGDTIVVFPASNDVFSDVCNLAGKEVNVIKFNEIDDIFEEYLA